MALNLWKVGGKPTAYNPLPIGGSNNVTIPLFKEYVITFKAKSLTNAVLRVNSWHGVNDLLSDITLTTEFKNYSFTWKETDTGILVLQDLNNVGNIIIDSIELVQKPLPKLTINGIDGFSSGKWTLHANAKVVDDETLELNATADYQSSTIDMPIQGNQQVTFSRASIEGRTWAYWLDKDKLFIGSSFVVMSGTETSKTFTSPSNAQYVRYAVDNATLRGLVRFTKPMLNIGSIPAPYEKKRGDKMVLPTAKKNLFDGALEQGDIDGSNGQPKVGLTKVRSVNYNAIRSNTAYTLNTDGAKVPYIMEYTSSFAFIKYTDTSSQGKIFTFTTSPTTGYFKFMDPENNLNRKIQLEEGTTATAYSPYAVQVNSKPKKPIVKAKTGLAFNGVTDYLQLPSMTMDSIEIECLVDSVQYNGSGFIVDTRTGYANGWVQTGGSGVDVTKLLLNGVESSYSAIQRNIRTKIKVVFRDIITDNLNIFSSYTGGAMIKGILYKVTCYLNGAEVARYNFENPSNLVGDKVIPQAVNLIPNFEDARWSLHANAKVLGKDVLHLDATGVYQYSQIWLDAKPNQTYIFNCAYTNYSVVQIFGFDKDGNVTNGASPNTPFTFSNGTVKCRIDIGNSNTSSGSFEFVKPSLYALDGKEGTLFGKPTALNKTSKRTLYAKR